MLRRAFLFRKVTRSWTTGSIASASAHFPDAVRVDPAAQRSATCSAKEQRQWSLDDASSGSGRKVPKHIEWVTRKVKLWCQLIRADKPVGTFLLLLPCYWGSSLAVTRAIVWEGADPVALCAPFVPVHLAVFFAAGAFLMRSAGCIVNDMWDRKFDRMVERTKTRPLASGTMGMTEVSAVLVTTLGLALVIAMNLSPTALLAALSITPLVLIYPFMKRITYMPQLFLGLCFNWGIFVGYAAVLNRVDLAVTLPIYFASVVWTILYDTIYAYQDINDDKKCGVKSSAILIGDRKHILMAMVFPVGLGILVSGLMVSQSLPFYIAVLLCVWHLQGIVDDVNIYDAWSCATGFRRNVRFALYVFLSMCLGNVFWALASEHQPAKDADNSAVSENSVLMRFLLLNQNVATPTYTMQDVRWVDRFAHPAYVASQEARQDSTQDPLVIPAWMRREYLGENVGSVMRLLGVEEEVIASWQAWWYAQLDHYNMFSKVAI
ncbi:putative prenyltransferase [Trypanosoma conorhini]|uniref:4-hydroxybenzoate polyprenyltransferase, mitochondrial n=1 Tax=Trypanosoma conorhini TaxID=83891 RepID=A0A3R7SB95_9TRYP|nr:putative prenyltransferase [Trypanosoma conorhini]RNF27496.1 putative prenyltransferase [Trypanosoma conorhini]